MLLAILGVILAVPLTMMVVGVTLSGPRYRGPVSDHFDGKRFLNPQNIKPKGGIELFKWMLNRKPGPWKEDAHDNQQQHPLGHFTGGIRITFVNHSTFLIQVDGLNILTDPVWSQRVSPFTWLGPKRKTKVKLESFECGIEPRGNARVPFPIRYFLVAILFVPLARVAAAPLALAWNRHR